MEAEALDQAKTKVAEAVDRLADDLEKISHQIHSNPELCFKEEKSAGCRRPSAPRLKGPGRGRQWPSWRSTTPCPTSDTPAGTT